MQPYNLPYVLTKERAFCKNHGQEMQGEIAKSDTLVLSTPLAGGVMACAQSVMFHAQQNMCSDVFWASNNQCACLRPGVACKEERSESGFSLYQLTRLAKHHDHTRKCPMQATKEDCAKFSQCEWKAHNCRGITLSKEHVLGAYPQQMGVSPQLGVNPQLGVGYPRTAGAMGAGYPAAGVGAMGAANLNTQLVPWRTDTDCEREIDEHTGLSNIVDIVGGAPNVNACMQAVQMNPQCNRSQFVFQTRLDGFPGECFCVRVNLYCDEESRPGYSLYDFTKGPNAMGGVPATGAYPQNHGMPPTTPGVYPQTRPGVYSPGQVPGAVGTPGVGFNPATQAAMPPHHPYPATQPQLHPATQAAIPPAYPNTQPGLRPGVHPAMAAATQAGMYPSTGYPQTGYGATTGYGTAGAYGATGAYGAQPGMYQAGMMRHQLKKSQVKISDKGFHSVVIYAVIPVAVCLLTIAVIGYFYKRYQTKRSNFNQHILMEDNTPSV